MNASEGFEGKVALITGGASGIGRAVAERLAKDGAKVVVADVDAGAGAEIATSLGGTFFSTDVSSLDQMRAAVDHTLQTHGRLDVAHLNAGVTTGETDIARLDEPTYLRALGINVNGVVFGTMAVVPAMTDGGAIVATASLAGLIGYPLDPIYALTKHAVVGFVRATSQQLSSKRITLNALCPGFVDTPILGDYAKDFRTAGFPLLDASEVAEAFVEIVTSGRTGEAFISQPGRTCEAYEFRGIPGPRVEGAEGKQPPLRPV